jgi:hypothetical protein
MRDIHGISGVRRTTTTLRRSTHGPREHSGHLGVDPCSFPSFRAMKSASSRSSMPLVSAPGPNGRKGRKLLGAFVLVERRTVLTQSYAPLAVKCAVDPITSIHRSERVLQDLAEVLGGIRRRWSKSPSRLGAPEPNAGSGSARPHLPWTGIEGCRGTGLRPPTIHGAPIGPHHRLSRRLVRRPGRSTFREGP